MPERRQTRIEEAASTIPSTWLVLANEINRLSEIEKDADGLLDIKSVAVTLAELILKESK